MSTLDKKALRELRLMRSQTVTIALVVAAGVAILISMLSAYDSLQTAADKFYRTSRFADVFATVKRAPRSVLADIENIPGVQTVEAHIVRRPPWNSRDWMNRWWDDSCPSQIKDQMR